jgi:hypothetical protein
MLIFPSECFALASQINEGASNGGIIFDPNAHETCGAEKGADISNGAASRPIADSRDLRVVWDVAIEVALVAENDDFWNCNKKFLSGNGSSSTMEAVEDAVHINEVFPNEPVDTGIVGDSFVTAAGSFIARSGAFNAAVVHKGAGNMWDFGLENKGNVVMEYANGVGPALRKAGKANGADRRLNSSEISRGNIKGAMIIANKEVEHRIA